MLEQILPGSIYSIVSNSNAGLCVTISGGLRKTGTEAVASVFADELSQKFMAVKTGSDTVAFQAIHSGHYLSIINGKVVQRNGSVGPGAAQNFKLLRAEGGTLLFNAASNCYLSVSASGRLVLSQSASDSKNLFSLCKVNVLDSGHYRFYTPNKGFISIKSASKKSGGKAVLAKSSTSAAQIWTASVSASADTMRLANYQSVLSLSLNGGSTANGTALVQTAYKSQQSQLFSLLPAGGGWFVLKSNLGVYVTASSGKVGAYLKTTTNKNKALRLRFQSKDYKLPGAKRDYRQGLIHDYKPWEDQRYIVLHDTEGLGTPASVLNWWSRPKNPGVATHFVIGRDGSVLQAVPLDNVAYHAGSGVPKLYSTFKTPYGMNYHSIGIEMIHVGRDQSHPYTKAQLQALDRVIAYIDGYYGKKCTIIDHKAWAIGNSDTSPEFARYLKNYKKYRSYKNP